MDVGAQTMVCVCVCVCTYVSLFPFRACVLTERVWVWVHVGAVYGLQNLEWVYGFSKDVIGGVLNLTDEHRKVSFVCLAPSPLSVSSQ